jgi:nucleoside-diphosphate-sugar epimerase
VLVVGSSGALGAALASHFSGRACGGWDVLGADVAPPPSPGDVVVVGGGGGGGGRPTREYVRLPASGTLSDLAAELHRGVSAYVGGGGGTRRRCWTRSSSPRGGGRATPPTTTTTTTTRRDARGGARKSASG